MRKEEYFGTSNVFVAAEGKEDKLQQPDMGRATYNISNTHSLHRFGERC